MKYFPSITRRAFIISKTSNLQNCFKSSMSTSPDVQRASKKAKISPNPPSDDDRIIWIDCEMTGLNVFTDHIIEICCLVTDKDLNVLDPQGYETVIHYDKSILDQMGDWCIEHHGYSGLTDKVIQSNKSLTEAEDELLEYISKYVPKRKGVLAGNSIHMDRIFMVREFPKVIDHLFYRIIDVSSIFEVGKRHNPRLINCCPKKKGLHTARSDILESIAQLKWYRDHYLKSFEESQEEIEELKKK